MLKALSLQHAGALKLGLCWISEPGVLRNPRVKYSFGLLTNYSSNFDRNTVVKTSRKSLGEARFTHRKQALNFTHSSFH